MARADYQALVTDKLRETASLVTDPQKDRAITEAVKQYSRKVRPRRRSATLTGNGSAFTFALPTDFEEGFSTIESVEHPVDKQEPEYLDGDEWTLYRDATTGVLKFRFLSRVLANSAKAYLNYTTTHVVNDLGVDTVPVADREPVACKATAMLFRQLAAYAAQTMQSTLTADSVDRLSQVDRYLALARDLEEEYARILGITEGIAAASAVADLDVTPQFGFDRFFHSRFGR